MTDLPSTREYEAHRERNFLIHGAFGIKYVREHTADAMRYELLARIADLEQMLRLAAEKHAGRCPCGDHEQDRIDYLAGLSPQRCEGCEHVRHHAVGKPPAYRLCALGNSYGYDAALPDDFACNCWQPREEKV